MRSVERAQPAARVQTEHIDDVDAAPFDQPDQLVRDEHVRMERIGRRVRAGGEREPIRRGDDQHAARAQRTRAPAQEALVIPDMLDHLQRRHRVERRRAHR